MPRKRKVQRPFQELTYVLTSDDEDPGSPTDQGKRPCSQFLDHVVIGPAFDLDSGIGVDDSALELPPPRFAEQTTNSGCDTVALVPFQHGLVEEAPDGFSPSSLQMGRRIKLKGGEAILRQETPESAKWLNAIDEPTVNGLQSLLLESLKDDIYDGDLKLLTATSPDTHEIMGMIFWRDTPKDEMYKWVQAPAVASDARCESALTLGMERLSLDSAPGHVGVADGAQGPIQLASPQQWAETSKIELIVTNPHYRSRGVASALLATCLAMTWVRENKNTAVLQVAGGQNNTTAEALYRKFGFEAPPNECFGAPNSHLLVLWDISSVFSQLSHVVAQMITAPMQVPMVQTVDTLELVSESVAQQIDSFEPVLCPDTIK